MKTLAGGKDPYGIEGFSQADLNAAKAAYALKRQTEAVNRINLLVSDLDRQIEIQVTAIRRLRKQEKVHLASLKELTAKKESFFAGQLGPEDIS